jgi:hypothetical protein
MLSSWPTSDSGQREKTRLSRWNSVQVSQRLATRARCFALANAQRGLAAVSSSIQSKSPPTLPIKCFHQRTALRAFFLSHGVRAVAPPYCTGAPCQEALQNRSSLGPFTTPAAANAVRCPIRVLLLHALALRLARAPRDRKRADGVGPARENASAFDRLDWTDEGRRAGALHHLFSYAVTA